MAFLNCNCANNDQEKHGPAHNNEYRNIQMTKSPKMIYLILILTLNLSCVDKETSETDLNKSPLVNLSTSDSLNFTSGVRSIFQDSKGNYWIGSHQEGVCLFDGKLFQYFTKKNGLIDNQVRTIKEDKNGNIWFGTGNGVSMYDGEKFTNYTTKITTPEVEWKATNGNLWFDAGENSGVNWFDGQHLNYLTFPIPKNVNPDNSFGVTGISKDRDGNVWIATYAALFNFDGKAINVFDKSRLALKEEEVLHIRSVFADSKGRIWIGNNGIGVLLLQGNSTINFSEENGLIHKNSSKNGDFSPVGTLEHVFAIEEDNNGNIWFGDRDTGAWKYDGESLTNYTIDEELSSQMIWDIYIDQNKKMLVGMAFGGVYEFNGTSFDKRF